MKLINKIESLIFHYLNIPLYTIHLTRRFLILLLFFPGCEKDFSFLSKPANPPAPVYTSHNFSFRVDTLGDRGGASHLDDVFIINENDAWAVGEIFMLDSTGQYGDPFNAARWNGEKWEFTRVPVRIFSTSNDTYPLPLTSVYAFGTNDVFVTSKRTLMEWEGNDWVEKAYFYTGNNDTTFGTIFKMWGRNSRDIYCVGANGYIVHFDGAFFQRIESGVHTYINDIWGVVDETTGKKKIYCTYGDRYHLDEYGVLRIHDSYATDTLHQTLPKQTSLYTVWFTNESPLYIGGGKGVFYYQDSQWVEIPLPRYYPSRIRGNALNDIFITGAFRYCAHYNGSTWKFYPELIENMGSFFGLDFKGDFLIAVGSVGQRALVLMGKR